MSMKRIRVLFWLIAITAVLLGSACRPDSPSGPVIEEPTKAPVETAPPLALIDCVGETDAEVLAEITGTIKKELDSQGDELKFDYKENTLTITGEVAGQTKLTKLTEAAFQYKCVKKIIIKDMMIIRCPRQHQQCADGSCRATCPNE